MSDRPRRTNRTDSRISNGSVPLPPWAGDGHGSQNGHQQNGHLAVPIWKKNGHDGAARPTFDPWSGDGHGKRVRDAVPLWASELQGSNAMPTSADWMDSAKTETTVAVPTWAGDGKTNGSIEDVGMAEDLEMRVNVRDPNGANLAGLKTKPTPRSETWKLVMLVVVFLVWVSTASTLLFLYMDQYLFP